MRVKDLPKPLRNFIFKYLWFRPAIVYAYSCINPYKNVRDTWAYVGQTRQSLAARHEQHMGINARYLGKGQPWSDLYPEIRIVWQGKCPDFVLDFIEMCVIKKNRPLFNYIHNTKNPDRIPKYQAIKERQDRDRLARIRRSW